MTAMTAHFAPTLDALIEAEPDYMHQLLTPAEAAKVLSTTSAALAQMRTRGVGPEFVREGTRFVRYRRIDIHRWVQTRAGNKATG